jgi:hypothetical protein
MGFGTGLASTLLLADPFGDEAPWLFQRLGYVASIFPSSTGSRADSGQCRLPQPLLADHVRMRSTTVYPSVRRGSIEWRELS